MLLKNKKDRTQFREWLKALRSGDFKQTTEGALQDSIGFCCLGVGCALFIPKDEQSLNKDGFLKDNYPEYQESLNIPLWLKNLNADKRYKYGHLVEQRISNVNDNGASFTEIADLLESAYKDELNSNEEN